MKYIHKTLIISLNILILLSFSCKNDQKSSKVFIPNVTGKANEVVLVIENYLWQSELGDTLKKTFQKAEIALPQPEPMFDLINITPSAFTKLFKPHRNLVIVKISEEYSKPNIIIQKNVFAKPQLVVNLISPNKEELASFISKNETKIRSVFLDIERNRIINYYKKYEEKAIRDKLADKHNIGLFIPKGYSVDVDKKDFVWISHETPDVKQNIFIYHYNYTDEETFTPEFLINKRNKILKKHVPGPVEGSYATTEMLIPPDFIEVNYKDRYFAQLRGLWKIHNYFMGGPFISFTTLDEKNNRVITIEGLVYAPQMDKRDYVRQMEGILYTFFIPEKNE
ncbi:DUF4837 family protein [Bacteroidota bacterium]